MIIIIIEAPTPQCPWRVFSSVARVPLLLTPFCSAEDLWESLEKASGKPIAAVMNTWTKQMGFPLIYVEAEQVNITLCSSALRSKNSAFRCVLGSSLVVSPHLRNNLGSGGRTGELFSDKSVEGGELQLARGTCCKDYGILCCLLGESLPWPHVWLLAGV